MHLEQKKEKRWVFTLFKMHHLTPIMHRYETEHKTHRY